MTESDSSNDSLLYLNLRSRRVEKAETDPSRRCTLVAGWPRRSEEKMYDEQDEKSEGEEITHPSAPLYPTDALRQMDEMTDYILREKNEAAQLAERTDEDSARLLAQRQEEIGALQRTLQRMHETYESARPLRTSTPTGSAYWRESAETAQTEECREPAATEAEERVTAPSTATEQTEPQRTRQVKFIQQFSDDEIRATERDRSRPAERNYRRTPTRSRSTSQGSREREECVTIPAALLVRTLAASGTKAISDTAVAPKPFTGRSSQDPEVWLEYFERYCDFRQLADEDRLKLLGILLHEGAADWFSTLPRARKATYNELLAAFKGNYYKSPELKWKEAGALWSQAQAPEERVEDFVTRLRKAAKRLEMPQEVLHYAVINGLRGPLRLHVVQQGVKTMDDTIRAAKIAEAAASTTTDAVTAMMLDAMKANARASEKQAAELKQLTARVATLTAAQTVAAADAGAGDRPANEPRRQLLPTPQNRQRQEYAQRAAARTEPGPRSFEPRRPDARQQQQPQAPGCTRCGLTHRAGACRAEGQECRLCGRIGHFARVCRSARPSRD